MALNLPLHLSAPSSIFENLQTACLTVLSTSSTPYPLLSISRVSSKPFILAPAAHVSLQEDLVSRHATISSTPAAGTHQGSSISKPNSYIWVNPNSPRASELRRKSYNTKYDFLVQLADKLNSVSEPTPDFVDEVLSGLGCDVVEQDAVTVLNQLKHPQTALSALRFFQDKVKSGREVVLYNVTMKVFRNCRELESAKKLFEEMLQRHVKPDNVTFSTIITCARFCGLYTEAVEWFEKMPHFGCDPDDITYSAMIDVYGRAGNIDKALNLYDRARAENWRLDSVTFATLIRMYAKSGNFDGCLNVYEEMKALKVKPNLSTYNALLEAMGRAKRPWQAKNIYKEMGDNGFQPNWGTYSALLRAFCRARYGDDARKVYAEMKEKGLELNTVLYNTMLSMYADLGFNNESAEMFEDMKSSGTCRPDSWTYSSMITIFSCSGQVEQAEAMLSEMLEAGFLPNIFVLTSLIQCYGKANQTDAVVRTFNQIFELGITPDERFCGSLLNVMTQVSNEDLSKLVKCVERANEKLGNVVKLLVEAGNHGDDSGDEFKAAVMLLFDMISPDVKKAYCNCLIDLCINLNLLERACDLLELALRLDIYKHVQARTRTQWSLNLKTLSLGAALTALHIWINDLSRALENGDEFPPVLGVNTGHGKHKYSEKGLASVIESHLRELNSPFREASDRAGWFLTTDSATKTWLQLRKSAT